MNTRERFLAIVLVVTIAGAAGGFVFYQFIWSKMSKADDQIARLRDEVDKLELDKERVEQKAYI